MASLKWNQEIKAVSATGSLPQKMGSMTYCCEIKTKICSAKT